MKFLNVLFVLLMIGLCRAAVADTGMFYNPERDGEGIIVTIEKDVLAFAFFTYFDPNAVNVRPPVVSPAPPDVDIVLPECITEITQLPYVPVIGPPVVSPTPPPQPPGEPVDTNLYGGIPVWYIGYGAYKDGIALGDMYYHKPVNYPYSYDGILSNEYKVATFLMEGNGEGFDLYLNCNKLLPSSLYMCNNVMTFNRLIIGK